MPFGIPGTYGKLIKAAVASKGKKPPVEKKKPIRDATRRPFGEGSGKSSGGNKVGVSRAVGRGLRRGMRADYR